MALAPGLERAVRWLLGVPVHVVLDVHHRVHTRVLGAGALLEAAPAAIHGPGIWLPGLPSPARVTRLECAQDRDLLRPALRALLRVVTSGRSGRDAEILAAALPRVGLAGSSRCPRYRRRDLDGVAALSHGLRTLRWTLAWMDSRMHLVRTVAKMLALEAVLVPIRDELHSSHRRSLLEVDLWIEPVHDGNKAGGALLVSVFEHQTRNHARHHVRHARPVRRRRSYAFGTIAADAEGSRSSATTLVPNWEEGRCCRLM